MKRAELQAMNATLALLAIAALLIGAGVIAELEPAGKNIVGPNAVHFWAGGLGAAALAFVAGLAWWGLRIARQQAELTDDPSLDAAVASTEFRMSYGDDAPVTPQRTANADAPRTLDTGFQRVVVGLTSAALLIVAGVIAYLVALRVRGVPTGESLSVPSIDPLLAVMTLAAVGGFLVLYNFTRRPAGMRQRQWATYGEAVNGVIVLGIPGIVAVGAASFLAWAGVTGAAETAAVIVAVLLALQGLELAVNAVRSYQGVEEFDQAPVDLAALPLVPMLTSVWVLGLKDLLAQSFGVARARDSEPGVIARMMPRVLVAMILLAILASTVRVVEPGEVAIRERLGYASREDIENPLQPGMYITMPWPIDVLVRIPTENVQRVTIGGGEDDEKTVIGGVEVAFWSMHGDDPNEPGFVTGDHRESRHITPEGKEEIRRTASPQVAGAVVNVWWRVNDPAAFYRGLSHSKFLDTVRGKNGTVTRERPIYEALVHDLAQQAVTQAFAMHSLDAVMENDRREVEQDTRNILQNRLNRLYQDKDGLWHGAGIEVVDLTLQEVHPPAGIGRIQTATGWALGPAAAYEEIVRAREQREQMINMAEADAISVVNGARAEAARLLAQAGAYRAQREGDAVGDASRRQGLAKVYGAGPAERALVESWLSFRALDEVLPGVRKIVVGGGVTPPEIWQPTKDMRMLPPAQPTGAP